MPRNLWDILGDIKQVVGEVISRIETELGVEINPPPAIQLFPVDSSDPTEIAIVFGSHSVNMGTELEGRIVEEIGKAKEVNLPDGFSATARFEVEFQDFALAEGTKQRIIKQVEIGLRTQLELGTDINIRVQFLAEYCQDKR